MSKRTPKDEFSQYNLTPQKIAVIIGLLTEALRVQAILVDANQRVEIVLEGQLNIKTDLDHLMADLGDKKFGDVLNDFMKKY